MRKDILSRALALTRECLERYWQGDAEYVLSWCAEDILWVASAQSQYLKGIQAVQEDCRAVIPALQRCHLLAQEYTVVQNTGNACTIAGRYFTTTDESEEYFLQVQQRCTFVWELADGRLSIRHLHISNPMGELKVDEGSAVVGQMGPMAWKYLLRHHDQALGRRIFLSDTQEGITHILSPGEILYAAADRHWCMVKTIKGEEISARIGISAFAEAAGDGFFFLHRCYVANMAYIIRLRPYAAVMQNGDELPIPVKKYRQVLEALEHMYQHPCTGADTGSGGRA